MTLQDIASIAEIAGALAVVISLIYVGLQVRQNTAAVQSATAQAVHDNYAAFGSEYREYITEVIMKKAPHPEARPLGAFKLEQSERLEVAENEGPA